MAWLIATLISLNHLALGKFKGIALVETSLNDLLPNSPEKRERNASLSRKESADTLRTSIDVHTVMSFSS